MELLGDTGHVESCFGPFGDGVSVGARQVTVCAKRTIGSEAVLDAPMVLLGDEAQVEPHFHPFGYSANLDTRLVHCSRRTYNRLRKCFGHTRWNS